MSDSAARKPLAFVVALLCLFPLAFLLFQSAARRWVYPNFLPQEFDLSAWRTVFQSGHLGISLLLSLGTATVVGSSATLAGFLTSKCISYHRWRKQLLFFAYIPFVISPVMFGVCLLFLFIKLRIADGFIGVVAAQGIIAYGFATVFFGRFWNARLRASEELVYTLGGSRWDAFARALLPMARGALFVCFCQAFLISWFDYGIVLIIGGGKFETLTIRIFTFINEASLPLAAASSCLLVLPPMLLFWANKKFVLTLPNESL